MKRRKRIELGFNKEMKALMLSEITKLKANPKLEISSNAAALDYLARKSTNSQLKKVLRIAKTNKRIPSILVALSQFGSSRSTKNSRANTSKELKANPNTKRLRKQLEKIQKQVGDLLKTL